MSQSLLHRVASNDMGAMQQCIDEYGGLIWSLARRLSSTAVEAEDAVQEVFIALWESASRFDATKGSEVTFVAMIARRRIIDRARQRTRRDRVLDEVKTRTQVDSASPDDPTVVDEAERAMDAISQLSAEQQRVLRLSIHQGFTHEQIARITEIPLGSVKTHARRGLIRVRDLLRQSAEGGSAGCPS